MMKGASKMNPEEMKSRTKEFAKEIVELCRKLPNNREGRLIGNQVFKSGTSVAANYRAACRGRSKAEFVSKLGIVLEEGDETLFWLELIQEMEICRDNELPSLMKECDEIVAIVVSSIKTAKTEKRG
jgi:four helix bundle protein